MEKQNWKDFAADLKRRPKPTIPGRPYYAEMSDEDAVEAAFKMVPAKREVIDTSGLTEAKMSKATSSTSAPAVPAAKILQPTGRAFFTKEAQFEKLTDMVRSKEDFSKQQAILKNSRAADLARFQSLPKEERDKFNNDFDNWVQTVYSSRTKGLAQIQNDANQKSGDPARFKQREDPGILTRGARIINDIASRSAIPGVGKNSLYKLNDLLYRVAGGQNKEDRDLATYQRLKSPVRDMGVGETIAETGKGMKAAGVVGTVREMFSPDEMGTNALNFVPIAGPVGGVTKGLQLANRFGTGTKIAAKLPSLVKSSAKVMEKALGTHLAGAAGGVLAGGATGMALGENGGLQDFTVGAGMGAVGQGIGSLAAAGVGKGAKALFGSKPIPEVPPAPFHSEIESRLREKMGATGATERPTLSTEDILDAPSIRQFANNDTPLGRDRGGMKAHEVEDLIATHGETLYPGISQINPADQPDALRARLRSQIMDLDAQRKALQPGGKEATAQTKLAEKVEAAKQSLPSSLDGDSDAWFTTGTKKQQDDKLIKGAKAYRFLREQGVIEPNPRFEGKTDVDLLTERIKQIQKETDDANAVKAETVDQKALKDELLKENEFRSEALQNEIDWAQKKEQTLSDINFAQNVQLLHKIPGRTLDEFKSLPVEHQGILLRDIDEMGSAGDYIREALGPLFDDLRRIASTSGYDPKRLRSKIDEAVKVMKASYGKSSDGINGTVGGSPTERSTGAGQQATDGTYSDVPQQGMAPMDPSITGQPQQAIGFSEPAPAATAPQQAIAGSTPGQIGYDPNRAGGQINLPDQSTGQPPIAMRDEPIGSRNELLGSYGDKQTESTVRRERLIQNKSEAEIQKILYDEILKNPDKAELFGIDRDIAIEAADPDSPFKGDLKGHLTDAARGVKANGIPKGFF